MAALGRSLVGERAGTHGDYAENAATAQAIKDILRRSSNWHVFDAAQRESLDLIATKIGRICAGNPDEKDHWADIAGYAELIAAKL